MRKFLISAATATALLGLGTANAALMVEDGRTGGGIVTNPDEAIITTQGLEFINNELNLSGPFDPANNTATATVGAGVEFIILDFDVDQSEPNGPYPRGIQNFSMTVTGDQGTNFSLSGITNDAGVQVTPNGVQFDVVMGEVLTFVFSGTAFATNTNFTPGYSVGAFGAPIPVPGAAVLMFSGLAAAGAGMARRRRQA